MDFADRVTPVEIPDAPHMTGLWSGSGCEFEAVLIDGACDAPLQFVLPGDRQGLARHHERIRVAV
jgi:hypothetical protein